QTRSPKSETRNKFKIRRRQGSKRREAAWFCDSDFGPSGLFRISSFAFRILDKVTTPLRNDCENPQVIFARALSEAACHARRGIAPDREIRPVSACPPNHRA